MNNQLMLKDFQLLATKLLNDTTIVWKAHKFEDRHYFFRALYKDVYVECTTSNSNKSVTLSLLTRGRLNPTATSESLSCPIIELYQTLCNNQPDGITSTALLKSLLED